MNTRNLITILFLFVFISAFSQLEDFDNKVEDANDRDTKIGISFPALLDLEGLILQLMVEYPINENTIFKNTLGYEVKRSWFNGTVEGYRIGGTLKLDRKKPSYQANKYLGISTLWKRSIYSNEEFLPQEESGLWKKADYSIVTDIIGLYFAFERSKIPISKLYYNIGFMFGPELIITSPQNIPENTVGFPRRPMLIFVDNNNFAKYKWRPMFRVIVDIGMRL